MDATTDPDAWLVARVQKGDRKAFEELVTTHGRRLFHTLLTVIGDAQEAQDVMQDTFLKAFEHIGGFRGQSKFSTWLTSIAINTATQSLRAQNRLQPFNDAGDESELRSRLLWTWAADPEKLCSQAQRLRLLRMGLRKIPFKYRAVLLLRDIEELSTEETATALGLGVPAVKARLFRARIMLRDALLPHFIPAKHVE